MYAKPSIAARVVLRGTASKFVCFKSSSYIGGVGLALCAVKNTAILLNFSGKLLICVNPLSIYPVIYNYLGLIFFSSRHRQLSK